MIVRVTYLDQTVPCAQPPLYWGSERIALERMQCDAYLNLYRRVGDPLRWDERTTMLRPHLEVLLGGDALHLYVVRSAHGKPLGFCEFDRSDFPQIELKHFGLEPPAQGRGLGPWLLATALHREWQSNPDRIWLHTDEWDHPAAIKVYERAGFCVFDQRDESIEPL